MAAVLLIFTALYRDGVTLAWALGEQLQDQWDPPGLMAGRRGGWGVKGERVVCRAQSHFWFRVMEPVGPWWPGHERGDLGFRSPKRQGEVRVTFGFSQSPVFTSGTAAMP